MLYYYYSNWILTLFILWGLGKLFSIDFIVDNIHTHQANTLVAVGFTFLLIYYLFYKGYRYEISFFIYKSLLHYLPWYITYKYSKKKFILLDWRQNFAGYLNKGDIYYDLSKIMHGILVSHNKVYNNYEIMLKDDGSIWINEGVDN